MWRNRIEVGHQSCLNNLLVIHPVEIYLWFAIQFLLCSVLKMLEKLLTKKKKVCQLRNPKMTHSMPVAVEQVSFVRN